jgi:protein ImuB
VTVRIACVWVPEFPVQALRRSAPDLAEAPLAVAAGPSPWDVLVAVAAEAAALGVRPGMTAAQARQVAPAALVRVAPAAAAAAADEALADAASGFSPRLARHLAGEVVLDVGGLLPRFGSEGSEGGVTPPERGGRGGAGAPGGGKERRGPPCEGWIAHELLRACRRVGLEARAGVASSVGVARVAARCAGSLPGAYGASGNSLPASRGDAVVVRGGDERAFMAPLPLALLEPPAEIAAMLARWGLSTAGELARLARREVALRLGPAGLTFHRLACGEETGAFVPDPVREALREGVELDDPLGALEPFLFVTSGLLARLAQRLELRGEGFAGVLLELCLEGAGRREIPLALTSPTRDVPAVLALARLQLEAHPPGAPVEGVTALVTPGRVRFAQGSLFGAPMPAPGKLSTTLARLAALVGPERVGAPAVPDTHRPGAFAVAPFALPHGNETAEGPRGRGAEEQKTAKKQRSGGVEEQRSSVTSLASCPVTGHRPPATSHPVLRAFRPPREARVDAVDGRPVLVWIDAIGGIVVAWAGPYRFAGEWWGDGRFARDDFDVATTDGSLLRLHFDRLERRWFADGVYD